MTLWPPGFYFDCAVQNAAPSGSLETVSPGEWVPACGSITEAPSATTARNLVTAEPAGMGKGFLTVRSRPA